VKRNEKIHTLVEPSFLIFFAQICSQGETPLLHYM
jgi:hypothetical protein